MMKTQRRVAKTNRCLKICFLLSLVSLMVILSGCMHEPRRLSEDYGQKNADAFAAQVINPFSPEDGTPVAELPGELADKIYKNRYLKEMTEKTEESESGSMASQVD